MRCEALLFTVYLFPKYKKKQLNKIFLKTEMRITYGQINNHVLRLKIKIYLFGIAGRFT